MARSSKNMSAEERAARQYWEDIKRLAPMIAAEKMPVAGSKPVTRATERALYWTKDPNVDPNQLWQAAMVEALKMGIPPEDAVKRAQPNIANAMYPYRRQVVQHGARMLDVKEQIQFDKRMAAAGPPPDMMTPASPIQSMVRSMNPTATVMLSPEGGA